jgi:Abnormal spindle-like microcephaly-assoc'd, ASPM-SPD-2-Hydin/Protein of unknown function (DUF1573)
MFFGNPRRSLWLISALVAALAASGCALGGLQPNPSKPTQNPGQPLPAISLSAQTLSWGNVSVGTSGMQSLLVFNFGDATLAVSKIVVAGKGFALNGNEVSLDVQPGHTADIELIFKPTTSGSDTGTLTFITNDPHSTSVTIGLSGNSGVAASPDVKVTPSSIAFGNVAVGTENTSTITVENTGTANLTINSLSTTGKGYTVIGPSTSAEIAPGKSISVEVILAPTVTGASSGNVAITTNASTAPIMIPLTGTAVTAAPALSVSATSISFGNVLLGALGSRSVTLSNSGNSNLLVSQLNVSSAAFKVSGLTTPATLTPGQSATVKIGFSPLLALLTNGSLAIMSNATPSGTPSATISLSGTGISTSANAVKLSWSPSVSPNIAGYNIYRSETSGGPYSLVSGPISGTTFSDANVVAGKTYYYVLTSVDTSGVESGYSSQAAVTVPGS